MAALRRYLLLLAQEHLEFRLPVSAARDRGRDGDGGRGCGRDRGWGQGQGRTGAGEALPAPPLPSPLLRGAPGQRGPGGAGPRRGSRLSGRLGAPGAPSLAAPRVL